MVGFCTALGVRLHVGGVGVGFGGCDVAGVGVGVVGAVVDVVLILRSSVFVMLLLR